MLHFLEKRDRWGNGRALWVVVGMAFLIPMAVWSLLSFRTDHQLQDWVPHDDPDHKIAAWCRRYFPLDESVLLTWEGSRLDDPRIERLVQKIRGVVDATGQRRGGSKLIAQVTTPQELIGQMRQSQASRDEAVDRLKGVLVGTGPLRLRLSEYGRARRDKVVDSLKRTAHDALGLTIEVRDQDAGESAALASVGAADASEAPATNDSVSEQPASGETAEGNAAAPETAIIDEAPPCPPHDLVVIWRGMHWDADKISAFKSLTEGLRLSSARSAEPSPVLIEECFQVPGAPVALAVHLSEAGRADRPAAFRWLLAAAVQSGIPADSIHMGGSAVVGTALNRGVLQAVWDDSVPFYQIHRRSSMLLSLLAGGILALWLLGSSRLAGLVVGVSVYATLLATSLVPLTGGAMNLVLVVLPTLVLVTTLTAAIHVANYWRRAAASNLETAIAETLKTASVPCLWAGLAAVIGQASLAASSLPPVREFGLYSAVGTLIALIVTLYGLPALLAIWPVQPPKIDELGGFWHGLANWIVERRRLVARISLLAAAICLPGLLSFKTETNVVHYLAETTRTVKDDEYIEDRLAGVMPVEVIVRFDRESQQQLKFLQRGDLVREIQAGIKKLPDVSGAVSLADYLPVIADPGDHGHVRERAKYSAASRSIEDDIKGQDNKGIADKRSSSRGKVPDDRKSSAKALLAVADDVTEFNAAGDELWLLTAQAAVVPSRNYEVLRKQIDEVCSSVLRRTSGSAGEKVPPVGALRSYHPGASHFITGELPRMLAAKRELTKGFLVSFGAAYAALGLVLVLSLRHPIAACLAMLPNLLPVGAVLGLISWRGIAVDASSAVIASISLGLTIGGTLHLVNWFRLGIRQGKTRAQAVGLALGQCGPALWQTMLVVSLGLLALGSAEVISIGRCGWLLALMLAAGSIADLVWTPALLAGPLGALIERIELGAVEEPRQAPPPSARIELPNAAPVHAATVPGKPHISKKSVRIRRGD